MNGNKKDMIYTAGDIEKYFSGNLSASQMHAIEKAALDDPFLAEAMEGYAGMKDKDWKKQLALAQEEIAEKGSLAKVVPIKKTNNNWWKTAAAVLLVGCGAALTFVLIKDKPGEKSNEQIAQTVSSAKERQDTSDENTTQQIAQNITSAVKDSATKPGNNVLPLSAETANGTASAVKENKNQSGDLAAVSTQTTADSNFVYRPQKITSDDRSKSGSGYIAGNNATKGIVIPEKKQASPATFNNTVAVEEANNYKAKESAKQNSQYLDAVTRQATAKRKEQEINNKFIAQVVGTDNSPLPFSNISIKSENFGTYADVKGNFRLVSEDSLINIEVKSAGYLSRSFTLRSNQPLNKIVLQEDLTALNGRTDINDKDFAGSRKPRLASVLADSMVTAEPADGWDNYNTYVANNIPDVFLEKDFHGEVGISFDINSVGTITNIRVDKSLGDAYDEAAKKLIQQGPQWKVKKGKKTSARVTVKF
jgi:TonB family protein